MAVNGHEPATKADIEELRQATKADIEELKTEIEGLKTGMERMETKLLSAFYAWSRTYEIRARGVTTAVVGFDERLISLEERVSQLERDRLSNGR